MLRSEPTKRPRAEELLGFEFFSESAVAMLEEEGHLPSAESARERQREGARRLGNAFEAARHRSRFEHYYVISHSENLLMFRLRTTDTLPALGQFGGMLAQPKALRGKVHVTFTDSIGVDAGGLTTELYSKLWEAVVDPANGLFEGSDTHGRLPVATTDPTKLVSLQAVGVLLAKTAYDGRKASSRLSLSLFKWLRESPVAPTMRDVIAHDRVLAQGINELNAMSDDEVASLCLEFEAPSGKVLEVDGSTREEYMRSRPRHVCVDSRLAALVHLRDGFESACHHLDNLTRPTALDEGQMAATPLYKLVSSLSPAEVRAHLCAADEVTAAEVILLCRQTGFPEGHATPRWIPRALTQMSAEQIGDFLYFVTAARCLPSSAQTSGRGTLLFVGAPGMSADHLPVSHTCFATIDLPIYPSFEVFQAKLLEAMTLSAQQGGFQFA